MSGSFGLRADTISSLKEIFARHVNIEKVVIYGSRSKGNFQPGSDIDLTLIGKGLNTTELLKIENEIEELMLPYKVDLSIFHQIENPDLIDHIQRVGVEF